MAARIILLFEGTRKPTIVESDSFGANSYVRKPADFERFVDATRQRGLYWLLLNELPPRRVRS
jgi:two-component system response regulator